MMLSWLLLSNRTVGIRAKAGQCLPAYLIILLLLFIFYSMDVFRPLRAGLFVYECFRLLFLTGAMLLLQPDAGAAFPWLAYVAPGALFPLMCLFWLLDARRYGAYGALYSAGKCVVFFASVVWYVLFRRSMTAALVGWAAHLVTPGVFTVLLVGDVITVGAALIMLKKSREPAPGGASSVTGASATEGDA